MGCAVTIQPMGAGDKLERPHDCPNCRASRLAFGKRHCTKRDCTWVACKCGTTYDMHGPGHIEGPA